MSSTDHMTHKGFIRQQMNAVTQFKLSGRRKKSAELLSQVGLIKSDSEYLFVSQYCSASCRTVLQATWLSEGCFSLKGPVAYKKRPQVVRREEWAYGEAVFLMIRRPPRSTHCISSAASDVYKRQLLSYKPFMSHVISA